MHKKRKINVKKTLLVTAICIAVLLGGFTLCSRIVKSFKRNIGRELNRTVTVYDYNGDEIKSWTGKFNVSESKHEYYFNDENGKEVVIHGGIIINEEN